MDFEKMWDSILEKAAFESFAVSTVPQNNRTPLWFNVSKNELQLIVDNCLNRKPSVKLSGSRRITKKDFLNVAEYYQRWSNGDTYLRQEVRGQSRNTAYIFGLISHSLNL